MKSRHLDNEAAFKAGDLVQRLNQPESIGIVREPRWDEQRESWNYLIQFGSQLIALPQSVLEPIQNIESPWDCFNQGRFSGIRHFIFTLTFHRLHTPTTRVAYAFSTARTQFYPHQFKPLLKFLDNQGKGLLIADDVGLGKTIEAGYILRELQARQTVSRVLVMVPARLAPKWKREMRLRFEEHFDVVKGSDLLKLAERIRQGREPEEFKWIVSYESARPEEVRVALDETQPPIDLLIADEAHRMRNPESLQHKVGATLTRSSDTTIFLTATPVQNRLEDLWHLLRLLSPEDFPLWPLFQEQVEANRLILAAQNALGERPADTRRASQLLSKFGQAHDSSFLISEGFLSSILNRLDRNNLDRKEIIEIDGDIAQLSVLGNLISRTRKVQAMPNRAVRSAQWHGIKLSSAERDIYDSVEDLCRMTWPNFQDSWGFHMSLLMAYRATASSIPAAMKYFAEKLKGSKADFAAQFENEESDEVVDRGPNAWSGPSRSLLEGIVNKWSEGAQEDSKLEILIKAIRDLWDEDGRAHRPRRKIVIFSYFRRTLDYLSLALSQRDFNLRMIHGGISVDEREFFIDEFLERQDIPLLLTSEVGGEGIDLQKASVLFNYDLPWNPMVVEQRIGRLDRIGQQARRIIIVNFIVKDSIEEYVLRRLLEKIEIFRQSIGEMDPIIGGEIERLTEKALSRELSENEVKELVEQRGDAIEIQLKQARTMLSRVDGLLAADQSLVDEINAATGERKIPSEQDLLLFVNMFLERHFPGCQLPSETAHKVVKVDLRGPLGSKIETASIEIGTDAAQFGRRISGGSIDLTVSREAGYRHPRAEMLHLRHPLIKFSVNEVAKHERKTAFALSIDHSTQLAAGDYAFLISLIEFVGQLNNTRLAVVIVSASNQSVWLDPEITTPVLLDVLEKGKDVEMRINRFDTEELKIRLLSGLDRLKSEWELREKRADEIRALQRQAVNQSTIRLRLNKAAKRLQTLKENSAADFPIRMAQAQLEKAQSELDQLPSLNTRDTHSGISSASEVAVGFLTIKKGPHDAHNKNQFTSIRP